MGILWSKKRTIWSDTEIDKAATASLSALYVIPTLFSIIVAAIKGVLFSIVATLSTLFLFLTVIIWILLPFIAIKLLWNTLIVIVVALLMPILQIALIFIIILLNFGLVVLRLIVIIWNALVPLVTLLAVFTLNLFLSIAYAITKLLDDTQIMDTIFDFGNILLEFTDLLINMLLVLVNLLPSIMEQIAIVIPLVMTVVIPFIDIYVETMVWYFQILFVTFFGIVLGIAKLVQIFSDLLAVGAAFRAKRSDVLLEESMARIMQANPDYGRAFLKDMQYTMVPADVGATLAEKYLSNENNADATQRNGTWSRSGSDPPNARDARSDGWGNTAGLGGTSHIDAITHMFISDLQGTGQYINWDVVKIFMEPIRMKIINHPTVHVSPDLRQHTATAGLRGYEARPERLINAADRVSIGHVRTSRNHDGEGEGAGGAAGSDDPDGQLQELLATSVGEAVLISNREVHATGTDSGEGDGSISVDDTHPHDLPLAASWGYSHHHTHYRSPKHMHDELRKAREELYRSDSTWEDSYTVDNLRDDMASVRDPHNYDPVKHMRARRFLGKTVSRSVRSAIHSSINGLPSFRSVMRSIGNTFTHTSRLVGFDSLRALVKEHREVHGGSALRMLHARMPDPTGNPVWDMLMSVRDPSDTTQMFHEWLRNPTPVSGMSSSHTLNSQLLAHGLTLDGRPVREQLKSTRQARAYMPRPPPVGDFGKHRDHHGGYRSSVVPDISTTQTVFDFGPPGEEDYRARPGLAMPAAPFVPDYSAFHAGMTASEMQGAMLTQFLTHAQNQDLSKDLSKDLSNDRPQTSVGGRERSDGPVVAGPTTRVPLPSTITRRTRDRAPEHEPIRPSMLESERLRVLSADTWLYQNRHAIHNMVQTANKYLSTAEQMDKEQLDDTIRRIIDDRDGNGRAKVHVHSGRGPRPPAEAFDVGVPAETYEDEDSNIDHQLGNVPLVNTADCFTTNPKAILCIPLWPSSFRIPLLRLDFPLSLEDPDSCGEFEPVPSLLGVKEVLWQLSPWITFKNTFVFVRIWFSVFIQIALLINSYALRYPLFKTILGWFVIQEPGKAVPVRLWQCSIVYFGDVILAISYLYLFSAAFPPLWNSASQMLFYFRRFIMYVDTLHLMGRSREQQPSPTPVYIGPGPGAVVDSPFLFMSSGDKFLSNAQRSAPASTIRKVNITPGDSYGLTPPASVIQSGAATITIADQERPASNIRLAAGIDSQVLFSEEHPLIVGDCESGQTGMSVEAASMPVSRDTDLLQKIIRERPHENHLQMLPHGVSDASREEVRMVHRLFGIDPVTGEHSEDRMKHQSMSSSTVSARPLRAPGVSPGPIITSPWWLSDAAQCIGPIMDEYNNEVAEASKYVQLAKEFGIMPNKKLYTRRRMFAWAALQWWMAAGSDYRSSLAYYEDLWTNTPGILD